MDNEYANYYCNVKKEYGLYDLSAPAQQFWENTPEVAYNYYHQEMDNNDYFAKSGYPEGSFEGYYGPQLKDQKDYLKVDSPSKSHFFYQKPF